MNKAAIGEEKNPASQSTSLKHNMFIIWKPEYNIGIPIIDEHHRGIVSTINSLYFAMQNNYVKNLLNPIHDMMKDYTRIHFEIEEMILENAGSPHAQSHHGLHLELSSQLSRTGKNSLLDSDPYPFMDFMKQWWINHICCEDLILKKLLD